MRDLIWRWLPVLLGMGLIFFLSSQPVLPKAPDPLMDFLTKKGAHFSEYFVLAMLLARAVRGASFGWREMGLAFCLALGYAISDEFHQRFVPGRTPSPWDVAIDATGAAVGLSVLTRFRPYTLKRMLITSPSRTT